MGSKPNSEEGLLSPNENEEDLLDSLVDDRNIERNMETRISKRAREKMNQENIKNYFPKLDMISHKIPFNYPSKTG